MAKRTIRHQFAKPYEYNREVRSKDNYNLYDKPSPFRRCNEYLYNIRVPRLSASKRTWKRFYELFPFLKGKEFYYRHSTINGRDQGERPIKLKKIK